MTTPQIIRTIEEFEALDPDTALSDRCGDLMWANDPYMACLSEGEKRDSLPAVVFATGDQVRAARKALEDA